jgi:hypothetical protein
MIIAVPAPRGNGKTTLHCVADRYEAAIRLERARQVVRECGRYGLPVNAQHTAELHAAEAEYDAATRLLRP